jgi:hypothetical protein
VPNSKFSETRSDTTQGYAQTRANAFDRTSEAADGRALPAALPPWAASDVPPPLPTVNAATADDDVVRPKWLLPSEAYSLMSLIWANASGYGERGQSRELTYGEVLTEGIQNLYDALPLEPSSVVLDLGSGVGKFTVYTALTQNVSLSWGIEVVQHRHDQAVACAKVFWSGQMVCSNCRMQRKMGAITG